MATESLTKLYQDLVTVDKKIEVRRTRSSGEKPVVVLDPSEPRSVFKISTSTEFKVFNVDVHNGNLELWGTNANDANKQTGTIHTGINGGGASINLNDEDGANTITIDGGDGTIWAANADLAERFLCIQDADTDPTSEGYGYVRDPIKPGDVLVISNEGALVKCEEDYDTRVAGVVSGANRYKPAIVLDEFELPGMEENPAGGESFPVALAGKVYCNVIGKINAGDLLVTSNKKGVAKKADLEMGSKLAGAILGKALQSVSTSGVSQIPILVMLG